MDVQVGGDGLSAWLLNAQRLKRRPFPHTCCPPGPPSLPCSPLSLVCPDILRQGTNGTVFKEHTFVVRRSTASRKALLQAAAASHLQSKHACQSCAHTSYICSPTTNPRPAGATRRRRSSGRHSKRCA